MVSTVFRVAPQTRGGCTQGVLAKRFSWQQLFHGMQLLKIWTLDWGSEAPTAVIRTWPAELICCIRNGMQMIRRSEGAREWLWPEHNCRFHARSQVLNIEALHSSGAEKKHLDGPKCVLVKLPYCPNCGKVFERRYTSQSSPACWQVRPSMSKKMKTLNQISQ